MTTKIIRFILIMIFILPTLHCSTDALNQTHVRPVCCDSSDAEEENQADENELIAPYTIEEVQQIRQNLVGTYRGISMDNRPVTFTLDGQELPGVNNFSPDAIINLGFLGNHFGNNYDYGYSIVLDSNSRTRIIGLNAISNNHIVAYFEKLSTNFEDLNLNDNNEDYYHYEHDEL